MKRFLRKLAKQPLSLYLIALLTFIMVCAVSGLQPTVALVPDPAPSKSLNEHSDLSLKVAQYLYPRPITHIPSPENKAVDGLNGRQIAEKINREYSGWLESLPACPCTAWAAEQSSQFRNATNDYKGQNQRVIAKYHPGGVFDFRQRKDTIKDFPSTDPEGVAIRPGQQCIYDNQGLLLNRGPAAGTPDIFGPEGTDELSYHHTDWDVNPFHELVGDSTKEISNNASGLAEYHKTWKPSPGQDGTGVACKLNPPPEKRTGKNRRGRNFGDPHLFTFDGKRYSFQQVGEFILSRSDDSLFEVQVRQAPINSALAVDTAVAMNIAGQRVALYADGGPTGNPNQPLFLNGNPITVSKELALGNGGRIFRKGRDYGFEWPTGEELIVQLNASGETPFLNITAYVFESQANHLEGLLGNDNGKADDDLRFRNGTILASQDSYGDLKKLVNRVSPVRLPLDAGLKQYLKRLTKDYGNDWRVSPAESLFDYAPGQSTASFTFSDFPSEYLSLSQLSTRELNQARKTCASGNVESELMEGCVFDVAFSGRGEFAKAAARIREVSDLLRDFGIPVPDLEQELRRRIRLPWGLKLPKLPF